MYPNFFPRRHGSELARLARLDRPEKSDDQRKAVKKLLRFWVLAAGVFVLLQQTRFAVRAQQPTFPPTCCAQGATSIDTDTPCDISGGDAFASGLACCTNAVGGVDKAGPCEGGSGSQNVVAVSNVSCQRIPGGNNCPAGATCPTSYTQTQWAYDPTNCTTTPVCKNSGDACQTDGQCCPGMSCSSGRCQSRWPSVACTPPAQAVGAPHVRAMARVLHNVQQINNGRRILGLQPRLLPIF
jgi:hypothetical protein